MKEKKKDIPDRWGSLGMKQARQSTQWGEEEEKIRGTIESDSKKLKVLRVYPVSNKEILKAF